MTGQIESLITWVMLDWRWLWIWIVGSIVFGAVKRAFVAYSRYRIALALVRAKASAPKVVSHAVIVPDGKKLPTPGECVHRNVVPVIADDLEGKPVKWLCRTCGTELPATWAVRAEDL